MNAEQLHTIASIVIRDIEASSLLEAFRELAKHLQQLSGNPGDSGAQQNVSKARTRLFNSLAIIGSKRWPVGLQQTIAELGGQILVSDDLTDRVQSILTTEAMTPSTAHQKVSELMQEVDLFVQRLRNLEEALKELGIAEEPLQPGEVELGVLIPRSEVDNKLGALAVEIEKIDKILKLFSVVATGNRDEFEIAYISSSDPKIFVRPSLKTAALVAGTVALILEILNGIADLKTKFDDIQDSGIEEKHLKGLQKGIEEKLQSELERIRKELLEEYSCHAKASDKNENDNRLKIAIEQLAPRLERGYSVEVRVEPLPEPKKEDEGQPEDPEQQDEFRLVEDLQGAASQIRRIPPTSRPVLSLPKPDSLDEVDGDPE